MMLDKLMNDKMESVSLTGETFKDRTKPQFEQVQQINRMSNYPNGRQYEMHESLNIGQERELIQELKMRIEQLENQLEYVKHDYQKRIAELNGKYNSNNQTLLHIIQEMKNAHNEEINQYIQQLESFEEQKLQMVNIQQKMNQISSGVEGILTESSELSRMNDELNNKLKQKQDEINELKGEIDRIQQNIGEYHKTIDEGEKIKLKTAKRFKDILEMIDEAQHQIQQLQNSQPRKSLMKQSQINKEICQATKILKRNCQHCKLSNLSDKYSKMVDQQ